MEKTNTKEKRKRIMTLSINGVLLYASMLFILISIVYIIKLVIGETSNILKITPDNFYYYATQYDSSFNTRVRELILPLCTLLATSILSLGIYNANQKSAQMAEKMVEQEKLRDIQNTTEAATRIHLSTESALEYTFSHYCNAHSTRTCFIHDSWINDLALIKPYLSNDEFKFITNNLRNTIALMELENNSNYVSIIDNHCKKIFNWLFMDIKKEKIVKFEVIDILFHSQRNALCKLENISALTTNQNTALEDILNELENLKNFELDTTITSVDPLNFYREDKTCTYKIEFTKEKINIKLYANDNKHIIDGYIKDHVFNGDMLKFKDCKLIEAGFYKNGILFSGERYKVFKDRYENGLSIRELDELYRDDIATSEPDYSSINYCEYYHVVNVQDGTNYYNDDCSNIYQADD